MKLALPFRLGAACVFLVVLACNDTPVDPPDSSGPATWRRIAGGVGDASLRAVWASAPDTVVAFGLDYPVHHFDGRLWSLDAFSGSYGVTSCWGTASDNIFASALSGTLLHFDGSQWTLLPSGFPADLTDVWGIGANDVLVCGTDADTQSGRVFRYTGAWEPFAGRFDLPLRTIWAASTRNIVVGGDDGNLTRYDGRAWTTLRPMGDGIVWRDSWGTGTTTYVVGDGGHIVRYASSILSNQPAPVSAALYAVVGFSENDVWAAGAGGTLLHFDGSAWSHIASGTTSDLRALAAFDGRLIAVGDHGTVLEFDGADWHVRYDGRGSLFRDMIGFPSGDVFAAGRSATGGGVVRHIDGREWSWSADEVHAIWGPAPDNLYVAGINGAVYHYAGLEWTRMNTGSSATLYGAHGAAAGPDDCVYAVGTRGTIRHWDGSRWSPMIPPGWYFYDLRDVWAARPGHAIAVGPTGVVLRLSGESELHWTPEDTGAESGFNAITGFAEDDVIAVTVDGRALHFDGEFWEPLDLNTGESLRDVSMNTWGAAAVVAPFEHLMVRRDSEFQTVVVPFSGGLNTTWTSHQRTYVAGSQGTIFEYQWAQ